MNLVMSIDFWGRVALFVRNLCMLSQFCFSLISNSASVWRTLIVPLLCSGITSILCSNTSESKRNWHTQTLLILLTGLMQFQGKYIISAHCFSFEFLTYIKYNSQIRSILQKDYEKYGNPMEAKRSIEPPPRFRIIADSFQDLVDNTASLPAAELGDLARTALGTLDTNAPNNSHGTRSHWGQEDDTRSKKRRTGHWWVKCTLFDLYYSLYLICFHSFRSQVRRTEWPAAGMQ